MTTLLYFLGSVSMLFLSAYFFGPEKKGALKYAMGVFFAGLGTSLGALFWAHLLFVVIF